ncbi:zinc-ribbon domain-containing protein [Bacillus pseudomycoides]|uniref:Treble clef zinc finger domain-containing protein n=2 Tax=Bacillus pseudomycoides TaxID=64104 RepID=A0A2C3R9K0_9BACI|nr:zinc-ribbon domain-containing protein [Bacillus pseudomycoides]PDY46811.1 hypothetical protein CON79_13910 [Bacillus pseudomycoides]PEA80368.1 hypothetical protein CON99_28585 [Bacillus pseudomycoides]PED07405.1 hypothetical protein COO19_15315 [Bacillus pseudomycoides]PED73543.1 hypothetical protein CON97_02665 [Bacillus pseudomycoides]PEI46781.1 hypothetical protein CN620_01615 [Bacillus pseudomycoides]
MKKSFYDWCIENNKEHFLAEWDHEQNEDLEIKEIGYGSNKNAWWIGRCNHQWISTIKNRVRGNGCPICYEANGRKIAQILFYEMKIISQSKSLFY